MTLYIITHKNEMQQFKAIDASIIKSLLRSAEAST